MATVTKIIVGSFNAEMEIWCPELLNKLNTKMCIWCLEALNKLISEVYI